MTRKTFMLSAISAAVAGALLAPLPSMAQDDELIEEIVTTGTRSAKARSASDSPVPVDVINADDFTAFGNTADLTDNIKALVPSYTATPATGDGSALMLSVRSAVLPNAVKSSALMTSTGTGESPADRGFALRVPVVTISSIKPSASSCAKAVWTASPVDDNTVASAPNENSFLFI